MSAINDGGPAFPGMHRDPSKAPEYATIVGYHGMTLRDYFAAKAMQGILSDSFAINEETGKKISVPDDADLIADCCYEMADAMLRAREEGGAA